MQGVVTVVAVKLVGTRAVDRLVDGEIQIDRVILTSALSLHNPQLVQLMADVLQRDVRVAQIDELTAVGAAIHGAVSGQVVANYAEGAQRFGAANFTHYRPSRDAAAAYDRLYQQYHALSESPLIRGATHQLNDLSI